MLWRGPMWAADPSQYPNTIQFAKYLHHPVYLVVKRPWESKLNSATNRFSQLPVEIVEFLYLVSKMWGWAFSADPGCLPVIIQRRLPWHSSQDDKLYQREGKVAQSKMGKASSPPSGLALAALGETQPEWKRLSDMCVPDISVEISFLRRCQLRKFRFTNYIWVNLLLFPKLKSWSFNVSQRFRKFSFDN